MEKNISKIDIEKNNSDSPQKPKIVRHPTPIKHRASLQKELDEIDMEDKQNNAILNKSDDIKLESSSNKTEKKRAQSYPSGFENIPKKYNIIYYHYFQKKIYFCSQN